jgi:hypothetical protein
MTVFGMYQDVSTIVRKTLHWKGSSCSMLEAEAVHHSFIL